MLQEAYARADKVNAAMYDSGEDNTPLEDFGCTEGLDPNFEDFADLLQEYGEPIYKGCTQSRMQSGVVLMTLVNLYSVSHNFMDVFLKYLGEDLLPSSNCLPRSTYDVKRMVLKMGLRHRAVHCCPNGHVLYEGSDYEDCRECPTCNEPRYIPGSNDIPVKVEGHRFQRSRATFNGLPEFNPPPGRPSGRDIMERGEERAAFLESGGEADDDNNPVKVHGVKRASILFELPY